MQVGLLENSDLKEEQNREESRQNIQLSLSFSAATSLRKTKILSKGAKYWSAQGARHKRKSFFEMIYNLHYNTSNQQIF